jgi:hypothetical protein
MIIIIFSKNGLFEFIIFILFRLFFLLLTRLTHSLHSFLLFSVGLLQKKISKNIKKERRRKKNKFIGKHFCCEMMRTIRRHQQQQASKQQRQFEEMRSVQRNSIFYCYSRHLILYSTLALDSLHFILFDFISLFHIPLHFISIHR